MNRLKKILAFVFFSIFSLFVYANPIVMQDDPLPSWNDQPIKKDIITFVRNVVNQKSNQYVAPADRIATIDNDGTLWLEQPMYTQILFTFSMIKQMAPKHPEWKELEPYKTVLSGNKAAINQLTEKDLAQLMAETHAGMTVDTFHSIVKNWLSKAINPRFKHHYTDLVYQPMIELINFLHANQFQVYIVTGGGQDFVRTFSNKSYQISSDRIIGTAGKTQFTYQNKFPVLMKLPELLFVDNYSGKPEAIDLFIGKKPIMAFGNSDGDKQMLEWVQSSKGPHFMGLIHHDDEKREYAYGPDSKVGTFSNLLMTEANKQKWHVVSMKNDWKVIFPFEIHS